MPKNRFPIVLHSWQSLSHLLLLSLRWVIPNPPILSKTAILSPRLTANWKQHVYGFKPVESYHVTGWVKTQDHTQTAFIVVQCWNREMTEVIRSANNQNVDEVKGTSDWVQITTSLKVPKETQRMVILAGIAAPINRRDKVWFDDIRIIPENRD